MPAHLAAGAIAAHKAGAAHHAAAAKGGGIKAWWSHLDTKGKVMVGALGVGIVGGVLLLLRKKPAAKGGAGRHGAPVGFIENLPAPHAPERIWHAPQHHKPQDNIQRKTDIAYWTGYLRRQDVRDSWLRKWLKQAKEHGYKKQTAHIEGLLRQALGHRGWIVEQLDKAKKEPKHQ